jgi:hypothetical protein
LEEIEVRGELGVRGDFSWESLRRVSLSGVRRITAGAFRFCRNLADLKLSQDLEVIGEYAFSDCTCLCEINLPPGLISIGSWAFGGCRRLQEVGASLNVVSLGEYVFCLCSSLAEVTFGTRLGWIGVSAFESCRLVVVDLSATCCRVIDRAAFNYWNSLLRVRLSATLERIGDSAYKGTGMSEIEMGHCERLEKVGAFWEGVSLQRLSFPDHHVNVNSRFVEHCRSLLNIDLNEGTTISLNELKAVRLIGLNFLEWISISARMAYSECAFLRCCGHVTRPLRPAV